MYSSYEENHQEVKYKWNTRGRIIIENEPNQAQQERSFKRFITREVNKIYEDYEISQQPEFGMREMVLCLYAELDKLHIVQPYMYQLIEEGARRVFKYRYNANMLSFSDNETLFVTGLFKELTRTEDFYNE